MFYFSKDQTSEVEVWLRVHCSSHNDQLLDNVCWHLYHVWPEYFGQRKVLPVCLYARTNVCMLLMV